MDPFADPYAEAEQQPPPPHRRFGCLGGCLGGFLAAILVVGGVFALGAWYFYRSFEHDPRLQTVMYTVRHSRQAEAVLGYDIHIVSTDRHIFDFWNPRTRHATYTLHLSGTAGEGELKVYYDMKGDREKITLMVLTGTDGHPHILMGKEPPSPLIKNSI